MDCEIKFGCKDGMRRVDSVYKVCLGDTNDLFYILMVGTLPWCLVIRFVCLNSREEIRSRYLKAKLSHLDCRVVVVNE